MKSAFALLFACTFLVAIQAHTWLDCVSINLNTYLPAESSLNVASIAGGNNQYCNGYLGGYVGHQDGSNLKVLAADGPAYLNSQVCKPTKHSYSAQYPRTTAKAGQLLTLMYLPNGHTYWHFGGNNPNPPPHGSNYWTIRWSKVPGKDLETVSDLINAPILYGPVHFDNACHSRNTGLQLDSSGGLCTFDYRIPVGTPPGVYQLVWWWTFNFQGEPTATNGLPHEDYINCFDVEVVAGDAPADPPARHPLLPYGNPTKPNGAPDLPAPADGAKLDYPYPTFEESSSTPLQPAVPRQATTMAPNATDAATTPAATDAVNSTASATTPAATSAATTPAATSAATTPAATSAATTPAATSPSTTKAANPSSSSGFTLVPGFLVVLFALLL
jgi:hypothetical protein